MHNVQHLSENLAIHTNFSQILVKYSMFIHHIYIRIILDLSPSIFRFLNHFICWIHHFRPCFSCFFFNTYFPYLWSRHSNQKFRKEWRTHEQGEQACHQNQRPGDRAPTMGRHPIAEKVIPPQGCWVGRAAMWCTKLQTFCTPENPAPQSPPWFWATWVWAILVLIWAFSVARLRKWPPPARLPVYIHI